MICAFYLHFFVEQMINLKTYTRTIENLSKYIAKIIETATGKKNQQLELENSNLSFSNDISNGNKSVFDRVELNSTINKLETISIYCCCSVTQSCPTVFNPMDQSMPGFPVFSLSPKVC